MQLRVAASTRSPCCTLQLINVDRAACGPNCEWQLQGEREERERERARAAAELRHASNQSHGLWAYRKDAARVTCATCLPFSASFGLTARTKVKLRLRRELSAAAGRGVVGSERGREGVSEEQRQRHCQKSKANLTVKGSSSIKSSRRKVINKSWIKTISQAPTKG